MTTTDRAIQAHLLARSTGQRLVLARECDRARRRATRKTIDTWTFLALLVIAACIGLLIALGTVAILDL
jgi:hypothetical protein